MAPHADLVVNCTSQGMTPNIDTIPWDDQTPFRSGQVVYDLVYNPPVHASLAGRSREARGRWADWAC